jgi:Uma2 family endonuclease
MSAALEAVRQSPRLPIYVRELTELLDRERVKRASFRATLTNQEKAEFINGEVVVHSPAQLRHTVCRDLLQRLLSSYADSRDLGWVGGEKVLVCLTRNDYEPDIVFYGTDKAARLSPDQVEFPPPDLVVEVLSESTEFRDRGVKLEDYAAHDVREYWLVDPEQELIEQYELNGQAFRLRLKQADATLRSEVVSGFAVPVRAVFDRA